MFALSGYADDKIILLFSEYQKTVALQNENQSTDERLKCPGQATMTPKIPSCSKTKGNTSHKDVTSTREISSFEQGSKGSSKKQDAKMLNCSSRHGPRANYTQLEIDMLKMVVGDS